MLKPKYGLIALSLVMGSLFLSNRVSSNPQTPGHFCFDQTAAGQVRNLTEICAKKQVQSSGTSSATGATTSKASTNSPAAQSDANSEGSADRVRIQDQARKRKIEFSDYSYDGKMVVGTMRNKTGKSISNIYVIYQIEVREGEGKWRTVDNGRIATNNRQIDKNGKTNFSTNGTRAGDRITITDVEFN